jgi:archaellum component FlaC
MIERIETEKQEIKIQNEQRSSMINEATIHNQERLNVIENQLNSLISEIINQGQNIEGLQGAVERHDRRLEDGHAGFYSRFDFV